ncbi:MAG TPA: NIL domain-containing protein [Leptolyngbyaceae cyanobacterium]
MFSQDNNEPQFDLIDAASAGTATAISSGENRPTQARIRIQVPKHYHQEPVISRLISDHGLTVNFNAALLTTNEYNDGWFDLELQGTSRQIQSAFIYLAEMNVRIWSKSTDPEEENW